MLRNGASRLALRSIAAPAARPVTSFHRTSPIQQWTTQFGSLASRRPQIPQLAQFRPIQAAVLRRGVTKKQHDSEDKYAHEKLKPSPETVSSSSTTNAMTATAGATREPDDVDMMAGVKGDIGAIRETFSLSSVPKEAYYMGLAGTLPYLATSIATVYCSWELNHAVGEFGYFLSRTSATQMLHLLEPLQIGYGASILSFLGAIHWGLEWAGFGGYQGYKRYAIGVAAPAVAWSTLLMPIEGALIMQFLGFVGLYYVDVRATYRGWTPNWYAIYRFVLTFIVGGSLVLTLIGRGELPDHVPSATSRAKVFHDKGSAEEVLADEAHAVSEKMKGAAGKDDRGKK